MTASTKDLIERMRKDWDNGSTESLPDAIAALERLTQPVGEAEPRRHTFNQTLELVIPHDSGEYVTYAEYAETVARLIAERDAAAEAALRHATKYDSMVQAITDPENQPSQYGTVRLAEYRALQEQVKVLRELVRNSTEYRLGVPAYELAATEPKENP